MTRKPKLATSLVRRCACGAVLNVTIETNSVTTAAALAHERLFRALKYAHAGRCVMAEAL